MSTHCLGVRLEVTCTSICTLHCTYIHPALTLLCLTVAWHSGATLHVCLMVPGASLNDASASVTGTNRVRFVVHRKSHRRLSELLGSSVDFQSVTFHPLALSDKALSVDVLLPATTCVPLDGTPLHLEYVHGFFVTRFNAKHGESLTQEWNVEAASLAEDSVCSMDKPTPQGRL